jgi:hypothetical protein
MAVTIKIDAFWDRRRVNLAKTDVSEERTVSIFKVEGIREVETTSAATSSLVIANIVSSSHTLCTLKTEATPSPETSVLRRPTRCHNPETEVFMEG